MEVEDSAAFCYDNGKQFGSCAEQGGFVSGNPGASARKLRGVKILYNEMMDTIGLVNTVDPELAAAMNRELTRQRQNIELIASENIVSPAVMAAMGSILTNKYAEGLPGKRYYGGCVYVDEVENIAIERACKLFGAK